MVTAFNVADYFLNHAKESDQITNLKLQKLVYYAQGFYLAIYDKPLFSEVIEAWRHGPVIPELYHLYKEYGSQPIPVLKDNIEEIKDAKTVLLLEEIYNTFGGFSAWALRNLTHTERPWLDTPDGEIITHKSLKDFFKTRLKTMQ